MMRKLSSRPRRRGFTLAEVIVCVVLLGVLGTALTRLMLAQSRLYALQRAKRDARAVGRTSRDQVTYSERGNIQGAQFHAVAAVVYEAAREQGLGRDIPTEWFLQDIRD